MKYNWKKLYTMKMCIHFLTLLVLCLSSCASINSSDTMPEPSVVSVPVTTSTPIVEPPLVTTNYFISADEIQNPERGFAVSVDLEERDYSGYYEDGYSLVYMTIRLDDYREKDLPLFFLREIDNWFSNMRRSGLKAIVRFAYNDGPYPNPEPDASMEQILIHIEQVKPLLVKNVDVIAWLEAGFIGAWGEWHTSTNDLDRNQDAKERILFTLLEALPPDRMVSLRYPVDIMTFFPEPLSTENAFTESYQARVGYHNDCFLSSTDDENTYARRDVFSVEEEYSYLSQMTQFVPVGGESCDYYSPRSDCDTALNELSLFHFDEISDEWYPEVLEAWFEQGCYEEIQQRLGYRISLIEMIANEVVLPGGIINVSIKLENTGFSSLLNPRPVYLTLDGPRRYDALLPFDPRFWSPGKNSVFSAKLRVPAQAPEGDYRIAIWMPDFYSSIQTDNRYAVQFANEDVWDASEGYNVLGVIKIDNNASGDTDLSAEELYVIP